MQKFSIIFILVIFTLTLSSCSKSTSSPLDEFYMKDIVQNNDEVTTLGTLRDTVNTIKNGIEENENLSNKIIEDKMLEFDITSNLNVTLYERDVDFVTQRGLHILVLFSKFIESRLSIDEGEFQSDGFNTIVYGNEDFIYFKSTSEDSILEYAIVYDGSKLQYFYRSNDNDFYKFDSDIGYYNLRIERSDDEIYDIHVTSISFENKEYNRLDLSSSYIAYTHKDYNENNFSFMRGFNTVDSVWMLDNGIMELQYEDNLNYEQCNITYNIQYLEEVTEYTFNELSENKYIDSHLIDIYNYEYSRFSDSAVKFQYSSAPLNGKLYNLPLGTYTGSYEFDDITAKINEYKEDLQFNFVTEDKAIIITFWGKEYQDVYDIFDKFTKKFD